MLGKAMRIATMCTLAFAICGERLKAGKKEEEKTSHPLRRRLAKGLLLSASVHAASGFGHLGHPAHSASYASRGGRRAGLRALEPLKGWGRDTINDPWEELLLDEGGARAWEDWRSNAEIYLNKALGRRDEELMVLMVEQGQRLLVHLCDDSSFHESEAEWKASEAYVRRFQNWQEDAGEIDATLRAPAEIHALATLKDAMDDSFSNILQAQRAVQAMKIWDVLDAAERGDWFNVGDTPWQLSTLQRMKGRHLQKLWLSTMSESAKRDAEKEKRDAEQLWLSTTSEGAKRDAEKEKRDAEKEGEFE